MIVFTNGSSANISTRFTREKANFKEVKKFGERLAKSIEKSLDSPVYQGEIKNFNITKYFKQLRLRKFLDPVVAKENLDYFEKNLNKLKNNKQPTVKIKSAKALYDGSKADYRLAHVKSDLKYIEVEINLIEINNMVFVTIPGEIFSNLTKPIRDISNHYIVAYSNGYNLYFADKAAYENKLYEASLSLIKKGESEKLISFIFKKLKSKNEDEYKYK